MTGSIDKTNRTLRIFRGSEGVRLQRTTLETAYELVMPTPRRPLAPGSAAFSAAEERVQATTTFATGTGGNPS
jgi:hypothetical protein